MIIIKQRILTGLVALPLLLLFIYYAGPVWFAGFVTLATAIGLHEYYAMSLPKGRELEVRLADRKSVV